MFIAGRLSLTDFTLNQHSKTNRTYAPQIVVARCPDKSGIHRAWETVSYSDESPNYKSKTLGTEGI